MKMFSNFRIQGKLLFVVLSVTFITFSFSLLYISFRMSRKLLSDAKQLVEIQSSRYANQVMNDLNNDFDLSAGMSYALWNYNKSGGNDSLYHGIMRNFIEKNPNFYSVWVSWELNAIDDSYQNDYGRIRFTWYREGDIIRFKTDSLNLDGDEIGSLYHNIKVQKTNTLTNPYFYSYSGQKKDEVLEVSACIPVIWNGQFAGLAGTDIVVDRFQDLISDIKPYQNIGYSFLLANDGMFVGHPDASWVGKNISEVWSQYNQEQMISELIKKGEAFSHQALDPVTGELSYFSYTPVIVGQTNTPWSMAVVVPMDFINKEVVKSRLTSLFVGIVGLLILSIVVYLLAKSISKPLKKNTIVLQHISTGNLSDSLRIDMKSKDEIGDIASAINTLIEGLNATAAFAREIGNGNLNADYNLLSENDVLGKALLDMRASLKKAEQEEDIRKAEDEKRSWSTLGQAKFADILRMNNDNMEVLSFNIIKNLVNYLNANQGGIFVLNDDNNGDSYLELIACYAYDRKKFINKRIMIGEGLVGACFQEKKTIFLTQVPQNYIHITSGLGMEDPRSLLIVPLIVNEEIYGVLEIASFKLFEAHQIDFIEKVAESIASTISSVKINIRTSMLLHQSQEQAEEMKAQEEEMRQNMEEMHATQEEMARKDHELNTQSEAINNLMSMMEYDTSGIILRVNKNFESYYGYSETEIIGKHISILFDNKNFEGSKNYNDFWNMLRAGKHISGVLKRIRKDNSSIIVKGITNPVFDHFGNFIKVVEFTIDIHNSNQK